VTFCFAWLGRTGNLHRKCRGKWGGDYNLETVVKDLRGPGFLLKALSEHCGDGLLQLWLFRLVFSPLHQARELESSVMLSNVRKENLFQLAETKY